MATHFVTTCFLQRGPDRWTPLLLLNTLGKIKFLYIKIIQHLLVLHMLFLALRKLLPAVIDLILKGFKVKSSASQLIKLLKHIPLVQLTSFSRKMKWGSLKVGKYTDLLIVSADPYKIDPINGCRDCGDIHWWPMH